MGRIKKELFELAFWIALVAMVLWFVWDFNRWEIEQETKIIPRDAWEEVKP
jgi:hypothetical protein